MVTIKNDYLKVSVKEDGAEICSVIKNSQEYIWPALKEIWGNSAPLLFPICGGLKDDKYILNGKEYTLKKHGFLKYKTFKVESQSESEVTFVYSSCEEDKVSFPFDYNFYAVFKVENNSLIVTYKIKNLNNADMYFSVGSHEAYYTPEGIEDYDIIFPQKVTLNTSVLCGNLVDNKTLPICYNTDVLPLYDKFFAVDALVFRNIAVKSAILRNRKTGKEIKVDFPNAKNLLLWHKHGAPFLCIEPWEGIPDIVGSSYLLEEKTDIIKLNSNEEYITSHTITI